MTSENEWLTDVGNARKLVADNKDDIRYVADWGWRAWDGARWGPGEAQVLEMAKIVGRSYYAEAAEAGSQSEREALSRWAHACESASRVRAMVDLARSDPTIRADISDFDQDLGLLNAANGTIDLRTGTFREHRRGDLITRLAPVAWDPTATAPRWERFVQEVTSDCTGEPRPDLAAYLQRAAGYTATGDVSERVMFIPYGGTGNNGKTVFVEMLGHVLGSYATTIPSAFLMESKATGGQGASPEKAKLRGIRLAAASEGETGQRLATAQMKELAGADTITARHLYQKDSFNFRPHFKMWFRTNYLPLLSAGDTAAWNRLQVVPFDRTFETDKTLEPALQAEAAGILRWIVAGAVAWYREGLAPPAPVREAVAAHRHSLDVVGRFLEERTRREEGGVAPAKALYELFKAWSEAEGIKNPWSVKTFREELEKRGHPQKKKGSGIVYVGLVPSAEGADEELGRITAAAKREAEPVPDVFFRDEAEPF